MAIHFLQSVDNFISSHLAEVGIESRTHAGAGSWVCCLLPVAIILSEFRFETSLRYKVAACICSGFLCYSVHVMVRARFLKFIRTVEVIICGLCTSSLLYFFISEGVILSFIVGAGSLFTYHSCVFLLMRLCPKSFTYGEASFACQGFVLFLFCSMITERNPIMSCMTVATTILQCGNTCVLTIAGFVFYFQLKEKAKEFYGVALVATIGLMLSLQNLLGENPFIWILNLFTEDQLSVFLFVHWVGCSALGVLSVSYQIQTGKRASSAVRKVFHVLALLVFVPGIIVKPCAIYLASGVVFAVFSALEMLRVLSIPPFGCVLQKGFVGFADEKDEGPLALTPIYLLIGCSLPLWIHPDTSQAELLPLLAGLLTVGVGDSAASVCGTYFGKSKWPGTSKTKEGTAACFISQLFLVIFLIHIGFVPRSNLIKPTFAIAISSIVEAKTEQVDNIVLPLIMYILILVQCHNLGIWPNTMGTDYSGSGELGVTPRVIFDIYNYIKTHQECEYTAIESFVFFLLYDLLTKQTRYQSVPELREQQDGICIPGLTEISVRTPEETLKALKEVGRTTGREWPNWTASDNSKISRS